MPLGILLFDERGITFELHENDSEFDEQADAEYSRTWILYETFVP